MAATTSRRRWFQFGLRGLFVAVTLSAVFVAWLGYNLNWMRRNAPVVYTNKAVALATQLGPKIMPLMRKSPWPLEWFGEPGFFSLSILPSVPESEVARIRKLFPESEIEILSPEDELEITQEIALHPEEVIEARQAARDEAKAAQREWAKLEAERRRK